MQYLQAVQRAGTDDAGAVVKTLENHAFGGDQLLERSMSQDAAQNGWSRFGKAKWGRPVVARWLLACTRYGTVRNVISW